MHYTRPLLVALASLSAACGGEPAVDALYATRAGRPEPGQLAAQTSFTAPAPISALGMTEQGLPLVAVDGRVYELVGGEMVHRGVYAEPGDAASPGAILAMAPRQEGGAWIAASAGLFVLDSLYLVALEVPSEVGTVSQAVDCADGPLSGLWLVGAGGLFRQHFDALDRYLLATHPGQPKTLALSTNGGRGLVAVEAQGLALLDGRATEVTSESTPLPFAPGDTPYLAGGGESLAAAGEVGLARYEPRVEPAWSHVTLRDQADGNEPVQALAVDALSEDAWMLAGAGLVRVRGGGDGATAIAYALDAAQPRLPALAVDPLGDVWLAAADRLWRVSTGELDAGVTFVADIEPWTASYCQKCHASFTSYAAFVEVAEEALARVRAGDMPRCYGGERCPSADALMPDDYAVLDSWIRIGMPQQ